MSNMTLKFKLHALNTDEAEETSGSNLVVQKIIMDFDVMSRRNGHWLLYCNHYLK